MEEYLRAQFEKVKWQDPMRFTQWQAEVRAVRARGVAIDEGRYRKGFTVVAVPIVMAGAPVDKFMSALVVTEQLSDRARRDLVRALQGAADEVASATGAA